MALRVIDQFAGLSGKKVFIRCDFNVALGEPNAQGERMIRDDTRIREVLPTIRYAQQKEAKIILASHLGRPKGRPDPKYTLLPVAQRLSELLDSDVKFSDGPIGEGARKLVRELQPGQIVLLENLRFHPGEEKNDRDFAQKLGEFCEVYINDAFGTMHRAHASVAALAEITAERGIGFLVQKEMKYLGKLLSQPDHPFVAILGGNKVSDKIPVIRSLLSRVDTLLIVGGMAYTFLKQQGFGIGKSVVEEECLKITQEIQALAKEKKTRILLPVDHVIADRFDANADTKTVDRDGLKPEWMALDIGPKTISLYQQEIRKAKTVFWNGPAGVFEMEPFRKGTLALAQSLAESKAVTIIGGGDSVAAIHLLHLEDKMSLISTGGGATLEFLGKGTLPGLESVEA